MALPAPEVRGLNQVLRHHTREGVLYEKLGGGKVRCLSCGHRCVIPAGKAGICLVRYNEEGTLYVPHGYVGSLQLDPVEKKPFFHAYPGSLAMSFGMLGCDYHCLTGSTLIATKQGPKTVEELFHLSTLLKKEGETLRASPQDLKVYTHLGSLKPVRYLFKHHYEGPLIRVKPRYLPPIAVTPEHPLLAVQRKSDGTLTSPAFLPAGNLLRSHWVVIPKNFSFSEPVEYDAREVLSPFLKPIRHKRVVPPQMIQAILDLTEEGYSSRQIGFLIEKDPSHVRHLRSKINRGVWSFDNLFVKPGYLIQEEDTVRFAKEHAPGLPAKIALDEDLAELFGYYTAEGTTVPYDARVQSTELVFSLGRHEKALAHKIQKLILKKFGLKAPLSERATTLCVSIKKASLAKFLEGLCGKGAQNKKIPAALFNAPRSVVERFLQAHVKGDGHVTQSGAVSVATVSPHLASGIFWLALKTGRLPSVEEKKNKKYGTILGRRVRLAPKSYVVSWLKDNSKRRWLLQDDENYYISIKSIRRSSYKGFVYNLEVEGDHSYLAQFVSTHNCGYCQNWYTSQTLRDPKATAQPTEVTPEKFVQLAKEEGARIITSTYNEPLITSEWAVEIFKTAKKEGLVTSYVSNGNGTPQVLEYLRPWMDLCKVDLKGFDDKHYRELGGVLSVVLETIGQLHQKNFWLEVVTLLVPGFNDSVEEIRGIAKFLAGISKDIPWHVTAFHQDYKMRDHDNTSVAHLIRAYDIGKEEGLNFVYPGNRPGEVGSRENTYCPSCNTLLIERYGFQVLSYHLRPGGFCPQCSLKIPGRWD